MPKIGSKLPPRVLPARPHTVRPEQQREIRELVAWARDPRIYFAASTPPSSPGLERFEALKAKLRESYLHPGGELQQELTVPLPDFKPLDRMHNLAEYAHAGKTRDTGEPYIIHPYEVCEAMAKDGLIEIVSQTGGMGHDIVEETENWPLADRITPEDIRIDLVSKGVEERTAQEIAHLIDGLTKVRKWGRSRDNRLVQSHMKLIEMNQEDPRVMIIKIYDRLCNSRSLKLIKREKACRIAQETLEIIVPQSRGLGMWEVRAELMENSFAVLYDEYAQVKTFVEERIKRNKKAIDEAHLRLAAMFGAENVHYTPKSAAEVFERYLKQKKENPETEVDLEILVKGLHSFAVIQENNGACYGTLEALHSPDEGFAPVPETFVDHIAQPTENLYEALHDIVVIPNLGHVLIKIMIPGMERLSRLGALSFYDPRNPDPQWYKKIIEFYPWLRQLVDDLRSRGNMTEQDIKETTQGVASGITVYTPKGEPRTVSFDSRVLDYAFSIHKGIGAHATAARIVRRRRAFVAGLDFKLAPGDQIEVITDPKCRRTFHDLAIVQNPAKRAIRAYLRSLDPQVVKAEGTQALKMEIERARLHLSLDDLTAPVFRPFMRQLLASSPFLPQRESQKEGSVEGQTQARPKGKAPSTLADITYLIGVAELNPTEVVERLKRYIERINKRSRRKAAEADENGEEVGEVFQIVFERENKPGIMAQISTSVAELELDMIDFKPRYRKDKEGKKIVRVTFEVEVFNNIQILQVKNIVRDANVAILSSSDDQEGNP